MFRHIKIKHRSFDWLLFNVDWAVLQLYSWRNKFRNKNWCSWTEGIGNCL